MRNKKRSSVLIGGVLLGIATPMLLFSQTGGQATTSDFMRLKLEPAKLILEGIATENYQMISHNAQEVETLTLDEKWHVLQSKEYVRNSEEFRRSVQLLRTAAKEKNLDGATLAYMQMTLNCVKCHRDLRASPK